MTSDRRNFEEKQASSSRRVGCPGEGGVRDAPQTDRRPSVFDQPSTGVPCVAWSVTPIDADEKLVTTAKSSTLTSRVMKAMLTRTNRAISAGRESANRSLSAGARSSSSGVEPRGRVVTRRVPVFESKLSSFFQELNQNPSANTIAKLFSKSKGPKPVAVPVKKRAVASPDFDEHPSGKAAKAHAQKLPRVALLASRPKSAPSRPRPVPSFADIERFDDVQLLQAVESALGTFCSLLTRAGSAQGSPSTADNVALEQSRVGGNPPQAAAQRLRARRSSVHEAIRTTAETSSPGTREAGSIATPPSDGAAAQLRRSRSDMGSGACVGRRCRQRSHREDERPSAAVECTPAGGRRPPRSADAGVASMVSLAAEVEDYKHALDERRRRASELRHFRTSVAAPFEPCRYPVSSDADMGSRVHSGAECPLHLADERQVGVRDIRPRRTVTCGAKHCAEVDPGARKVGCGSACVR